MKNEIKEKIKMPFLNSLKGIGDSIKEFLEAIAQEDYDDENNEELPEELKESLLHVEAEEEAFFSRVDKNASKEEGIIIQKVEVKSPRVEKNRDVQVEEEERE